MEEVTTVFKSEIFRPVVTLIVPGSIALAPYVIVTSYYNPQVPEFWKEYPTAFVTGLVICVIAAGHLLENIGSRIETFWDGLIDKDCGDHNRNWDLYLKLKINDEYVGQRYLRNFLTRMKFELAMIPALVFFLSGLIWVNQLHNLWTGYRHWIVYVVIGLLIPYLLYESHTSSCRLSEVRKLILQANQMLPESELTGPQPPGQSAEQNLSGTGAGNNPNSP